MDDSMMGTAQKGTIEIPTQQAWYEQPMSLDDVRTCITANFLTIKRSFVAIGFYLKKADRDKTYLEGGYSSILEFAKNEYGLSQSVASRYMSICSRFSEGGNSPNLQKRYQDFDKSKLQEMLSLTDEQLEQVTPEMRVEDIRAMKPGREKKPYDIPYFEVEGQLDLETSLPEIFPDSMAATMPEEMPSLPQSQSFTVNVSDLFPKEETIAISQQQETIAQGECYHRPGYPCAMTLQQTETGAGGQCGNGCCWNCGQHGSCNIECYSSAQRPEPAEDETTDVSQADTEQQREQEWLIRCTVLKEICEDVCYLESAALEEAGYSMEAIKQISNTECVLSSRHDYNVYCRNSRWHVKERQGEGEWVFESGEMEQHIWNFEGRAWRSRKQGEGHHEQEEKKAEADEAGGIIDTEFSEVETTENENLTDLQIARQELERANNLLIKCLSDLPDENNVHIRGMKLKISALASLVCDLDDMENPPPKPEQLELPLLKNNDQRAAFVDAYETWPLWIETMETGERYYRYDLTDGTSMVVKVYHARLFDYSVTGLNYEERFSEGWGKQEYYLLKPEKFFKDCEASRTVLIEKLKEIQKKN